MMGGHRKPNQHHRRWSDGWLASGEGVHLRVWRNLAKFGRSRWPETRFQRAKHLQHSGEVGAPCGSSGGGWGRAGGSETADLGICIFHQQCTTLANFSRWTPEFERRASCRSLQPTCESLRNWWAVGGRCRFPNQLFLNPPPSPIHPHCSRMVQHEHFSG